MTCRLLSAIAATLLLVACQMGLPGGGGDVAPPTSAPDEIAVTSLDAPGAGQTTAASGADASASPEAAKPTMTADELVPSGSDAGTPDEAQQADETAKPEAPAAEVPQVPAELKSPTQTACEKKGGTFANAGSSGAKVCVFATHDGGKSCKKESDCEGLCLARSRTCSPFTPVFGCQEILQQDGLQVTQCTE